MLTLTVLVVACLAQADPIGEKLDKERAAYHDDRGEVIADLLKTLTKKEKDERERRNPRQAVLEALKSDREHLTERGWLPDWADRRLKAKVSKARDSLKRALSRAQSDYVKKKQDAAAARANRELAWLDKQQIVVPAEDPRWEWHGGGSVFRMESDIKWHERNGTGNDYFYTEHARNEEFVEAVDSQHNTNNGGTRLRIFNDKALLWNRSSYDRDPDLVYNGQWIPVGKPQGVLGYRDPRQVWKHDRGHFTKGPNGWNEVDPLGNAFIFKEVAKTWEGIDILDKSRNGPGGVLVRLSDDKVEVWFDNHTGPPLITYVGGWQP